MKLALALLVVMAITGGHFKGPAIVSQRNDVLFDDFGQQVETRYLTVRNPLSRAVWVYVECESHLTVAPVGVGKKHTESIRLDGVGPKELCSINHWVFQIPGKSPEEWRP